MQLKRRNSEFRVKNKHVPGREGPGQDGGVGLEDGPCLAPELGRGLGSVRPGVGVLPWIRADLRMILLVLDLVGMFVHSWYQSLSLWEVERF